MFQETGGKILGFGYQGMDHNMFNNGLGIKRDEMKRKQTQLNSDCVKLH